ncbi:MAG: hypothetical protein QG579_204 [Patescibacteria group bacterium]|jgi:hypothetical protein|nr:hypothetical protein [Patescibacteria group bacterium]
MSFESRKISDSLEAGPEDLLDKKLFDTGVMEFETKAQFIESELEMAKAKLLEVKLLGQAESIKQAEDKINELEVVLAEAKEKLVNVYVGLIPTLIDDKVLLRHLKQRIIQNKLLSREQRMTILDILGDRN